MIVIERSSLIKITLDLKTDLFFIGEFISMVLTESKSFDILNRQCRQDRRFVYKSSLKSVIFRHSDSENVSGLHNKRADPEPEESILS